MFIRRLHFFFSLGVVLLLGILLGSLRGLRPQNEPNRPRRARISELVASVGLTDEQKARMDQILEKGRSRMLAFNEKFRAQFEEIRQQTRNEMRSVLTQEQREQFDRLLEARDEEHPPGDPGRIPPR